MRNSARQDLVTRTTGEMILESKLVHMVLVIYGVSNGDVMESFRMMWPELSIYLRGMYWTTDHNGLVI